jgi:DNA adenine methylase
MMGDPKPFLKWAGGKRQLLPELKKYIPEFNRYYEPFVGAGALLFELQPKIAIINDINSELINCFRVIKDYPKQLIIALSWFFNTEEDYYNIRDWDRSKIWSDPLAAGMDFIRRAARTIYLNKTCFNGLYRVNSKGQFNVAYGKYEAKFKPDEENILAVSKYLNESQVTILNGDFEAAVKDAQEGDFVYFDPPYDPVSETANFTSYTRDGFGKDEQVRLCNLIGDLTKRGVNVMASNAYTPFITGLYDHYDFNLFEVQAKRAINSKGSKRGSVSEVIITNFVPRKEAVGE